MQLIAGNDVMGGGRQTFGVASHGQFGRSGSQERPLARVGVCHYRLALIALPSRHHCHFFSGVSGFATLGRQLVEHVATENLTYNIKMIVFVTA